MKTRSLVWAGLFLLPLGGTPGGQGAPSQPDTSPHTEHRVAVNGITVDSDVYLYSEVDMSDPFVGTWELNPAKSDFDANHRPSAATMQFELGEGGTYLMKAKGVNQKGEPVAERPATLIPDGRAYPVPDFSGLSAVTTRPDPRTLRAECRREDGSLVGEGSYVVSEDGASLTATTAGFDTQLRRFEQKTVWDKL